jgi:hypothetical protein
MMLSAESVFEKRFAHHWDGVCVSAMQEKQIEGSRRDQSYRYNAEHPLSIITAG